MTLYTILNTLNIPPDDALDRDDIITVWTTPDGDAMGMLFKDQPLYGGLPAENAWHYPFKIDYEFLGLSPAEIMAMSKHVIKLAREKGIELRKPKSAEGGQP